MKTECSTRSALKVIESMGYKIPRCPHIHWLDKLGHHIVVACFSEFGLSAFELKYDPEECDYTYFSILNPLPKGISRF